jgi:hypothetical protein
VAHSAVFSGWPRADARQENNVELEHKELFDHQTPIVKFPNIDIILDAILQYIIRGHFDDDKLIVLLVKIGILSCVRTWAGQSKARPHVNVTGRTSKPLLCFIMRQGVLVLRVSTYSSEYYIKVL